MKPGESAKLRPICTPPKYTWRPQVPGAVLLSPRRRLVLSSGHSRVKVVSSRRDVRAGSVSSLLRLRPTKVLVSPPNPLDTPTPPTPPHPSQAPIPPPPL